MDATARIPPEPEFSARLIHNLPPELLIDIFLHLYKDPSIPRASHDLHNTHKLTFIMLVCTDWKRIVEHAPTLWADMWVGRCPRYIKDDGNGQWQDYLKTRFTRSGTLPLNLTVMVTYVDLLDLSHILLQNISRCKTLAFRVPKAETNGAPWFEYNTPSLVHRILSSPLPVLQMITIGEFTLQKEFFIPKGVLQLDAPNLRDIFTESPDIIPFVKPQLPHFSGHSSLERLTISVGWDNIVPNLPRNRLSLPSLKFLSVTYIDQLWNLLQAIDIPNIKHFVINCALAEWPAGADAVIPVMSNLRELEWYTDPDATEEEPNFRHLLKHCPNITSLSYICEEESSASLRQHLEHGVIFFANLWSCTLLTETEGGRIIFCPKLRRFRIACAEFEQIRELVLLRPMLESLSMQVPTPWDVTVEGSEAAWRDK
ncbi:hypothetical protein FRC01_013289, partial [Tulasnella sp. 417]